MLVYSGYIEAILLSSLGFRLASLAGTLPAGGSFCSGKRNQNPPRAFPPRYPPWGTRLGVRQVWVRPVCLAVAPICATTPGPLGQLALWRGGFHIRAYSREAAFPPLGARLSVGRCRGGACPSRISQGNTRGASGPGKPGPYHSLPELRSFMNPCRTCGTPQFFIIHFFVSSNTEISGRLNIRNPGMGVVLLPSPRVAYRVLSPRVYTPAVQVGNRSPPEPNTPSVKGRRISPPWACPDSTRA